MMAIARSSLNSKVCKANVRLKTSMGTSKRAIQAIATGEG